MTQGAFAAALGVTRGAVGNWETGGGVARESLAAISRQFGVSLDWLDGKDLSPPPPAPNAGLPAPAPMVVTVPAYGQAIGGDDGYFVLNGRKIADLLAPSSLMGVRDAYAVLVSGESMEPRYEAGEAVFVNPHVPVRRGHYVVAQVRVPGDEMPRGYVKRFVRMSGDRLVLEQLNPAKELVFPRQQVVSVHRIVASGEG